MFRQFIRDLYTAFIQKPFTWKGIANRREFWSATLFLWVFSTGMYIASNAIKEAGETLVGPPMLWLILLAVFLVVLLLFWWATVSVGIRRYHDTGLSAWWYWLVAWLVPLVWGWVATTYLVAEGMSAAMVVNISLLGQLPNIAILLMPHRDSRYVVNFK